jgi:hypothetical protein
MAYVYRHIRLDKNEPFYIGIGSDIDYKRAFSKHSRNKYWNRIVNVSEYEVEIIMDDLSKDEAKQKEIEFIALYGKKINKNGTLTNISDGGEGNAGGKHTKEAKIKIAEANKLKDYSTFDRSFMQTKEYKEKISLIHKGRKPSKKCIEVNRERMKNRIVTDEQKQTLRELRLGKKANQETKDKMRISGLLAWQKRKNKSND